MKRILICFSGLFLLSCHYSHTANSVSPVTVPAEYINPSEDQTERRKQSEAYCKSYHIPVYTNPNALFADPEDSVSIRTKAEVIDRALALCYIGLKSEGLEKKYLDEMDKEFNVSAKLTPNELVYTTAKRPTKQQTIDANWKYEDLHVMLWALGFIDTLSYPNHLCNVAADTKIIHDLTAKQFAQKAKLRSKKEILDQADLVLRLDWACVNARTNKQPAPANLDKDVVYERHFALNWLINYLGENWDDITTDT